MQVAQGMLWVWGDSSPAAHIHAAAAPAHTVPWMDMQACTHTACPELLREAEPELLREAEPELLREAELCTVPVCRASLLPAEAGR